MPRQIHLSISALSDLGDDMELIQLELCASLPEQDPLPTGVGDPFSLGFGAGELARGDGRFEVGETGLACREVGEEVKVVVVEVCMCSRAWLASSPSPLSPSLNSSPNF